MAHLQSGQGGLDEVVTHSQYPLFGTYGRLAVEIYRWPLYIWTYDPDMTKKLAIKGEIVTCSMGHPMFLLLGDLLPKDIVRSHLFKGLNGVPDPVQGQRLDAFCCPTCGAICFTPQRIFINGQPRGGGHYAEWEPIEETVTLPDFIEAEAKGQMKMINGVVHKRINSDE